MPSTDLSLCCQAFRVPKLGHTQAECEDAWAIDLSVGRFAVADGASESAFAGLWARLLTEVFVASSHAEGPETWLAESRSRWNGAVQGLELPWYAEMKREQGAFATFLGLRVRPTTKGQPWRWQAEAIGDSCLIRVRKGRAVGSFPITSAEHFGNEPRLLSSRAGLFPERDRISGSLILKDQLFLMTDALAQWFLLAHERNERPWEAIRSLLSGECSEDVFESWVDELRTRGDIRNDDVTVLFIELKPNSEE